MVSTKASGLGVVAIVIMALGIAGTLPIGIHSECADGIDNDNDFDPLYPPEFGADAYDSDCKDYPFADGNGETATPPGDRFNSIVMAYQLQGFDTTFDWQVFEKNSMPHPFVIPGQGGLPIYCPMGGTVGYNGGFNMADFSYGFADYPAAEGSTAAFQAYWSGTCPLF